MDVKVVEAKSPEGAIGKGAIQKEEPKAEKTVIVNVEGGRKELPKELVLNGTMLQLASVSRLDDEGQTVGVDKKGRTIVKYASPDKSVTVTAERLYHHPERNRWEDGRGTVVYEDSRNDVRFEYDVKFRTEFPFHYDFELGDFRIAGFHFSTKDHSGLRFLEPNAKLQPDVKLPTAYFALDFNDLVRQCAKLIAHEEKFAQVYEMSRTELRGKLKDILGPLYEWS